MKIKNNWQLILIKQQKEKEQRKHQAKLAMAMRWYFWRVDALLFFIYNIVTGIHKMDKEKLKLIVKNLESLVNCLKSEIYSDSDSESYRYEEIIPYINDYDEVFYDDDDGYADWWFWIYETRS